MQFFSDVRNLYDKFLYERVTECQICLQCRIKKIYKLFCEYNNWPDWIVSILSIILALSIALFLTSKNSQECLNNFYKFLFSDNNFTLFWESKDIKDLIWLETLGWGLVTSILFLSFKFAARLKGIRLFIFFLLGFLSVKYWTEEGHNDSRHITNIPELNPIFLKSFPQIIVIVILGILLYLFIRWLSISRGIIILPFDFEDENLTNQKDNLREKQSISDLLAAELHKIYHIHNLIEDGKRKIQPKSSLLAVCREDINFPLGKITGEIVGNTIAQLETVSISKELSLPFGSLLLALQQLWPQGTVQIITGSIVQKQNSDLQIAARYQQSNRRFEVHAYKIDSNQNSDLSDMIEELAYRIALDLSIKPLSTNSWQAFKFLTEALHHICHYERTNSIDDLNNAKDSCLNAKEKDRNYSKVGEILSLLGFYYLSKDLYGKARDVLNEAIKISHKNPSILTVYGHNYYYSGDYETALKYYNYAKELAKNLKLNYHEIYIRIGILQAIKNEYNNARKNFLRSRCLECDNHAAQSALAWLDFLCHLQELENGNDRKATWRLEKAYRRLARMDSQKKTNIDYGNLAIVLLYKDNIIKAYDNWRKALQSCQNETISDKIKYIFYDLLVRSETIDSEEIIDRRLNYLNELLQNHKVQQNILPTAVINDILKDAKIIWKKCFSIQNREAEKLLINRILANSIIFNCKYEKSEEYDEKKIGISEAKLIHYFKYETIEILDAEMNKECVLFKEHRKLEFFMRRFIAFLEWIKTPLTA
jgi:hypothetical protein